MDRQSQIAPPTMALQASPRAQVARWHDSRAVRPQTLLRLAVSGLASGQAAHSSPSGKHRLTPQPTSCGDPSLAGSELGAPSAGCYRPDHGVREARIPDEAWPSHPRRHRPHAPDGVEGQGEALRDGGGHMAGHQALSHDVDLATSTVQDLFAAYSFGACNLEGMLWQQFPARPSSWIARLP